MNTHKEVRKSPAFWAWVYLGVALLELLFISIWPAWELLTKPLLMPVLIMYFVQQSKAYSSVIRIRMIVALALSWAGDVFLMFQGQSEWFFVLGLGSFLVAHIFYILVFERATAGRLQLSFLWMVMYSIYGYQVLTRVWNQLEDLKIPVAVYCFVLIAMAVLATARMTTKKSFYLVVGGATLFVISDSMIALNKFYQPVPMAGLLIMATYIAAQYLIVEGICRHQSPVRKVK